MSLIGGIVGLVLSCLRPRARVLGVDSVPEDPEYVRAVLRAERSGIMLEIVICKSVKDSDSENRICRLSCIAGLVVHACCARMILWLASLRFLASQCV